MTYQGNHHKPAKIEGDISTAVLEAITRWISKLRLTLEEVSNTLLMLASVFSPVLTSVGLSLSHKAFTKYSLTLKSISSLNIASLLKDSVHQKSIKEKRRASPVSSLAESIKVEIKHKIKEEIIVFRDDDPTIPKG